MDRNGSFDDDELVDVVWTAPATQNNDQDYTLTITVTDPFGAQGTATITFTVEGTATGICTSLCRRYRR